jgi:hypothetical protein
MRYYFSFDKKKIRMLYMSFVSLFTLIFFMGWLLGMTMPMYFLQLHQASETNKTQENFISSVSYISDAVAKTYPEPENIAPIPKPIVVQRLETLPESEGAKLEFIIAQGHSRREEQTSEKVFLHLVETGLNQWKFETASDNTCPKQVSYAVLVGSFSEKSDADKLKGKLEKLIKESKDRYGDKDIPYIRKASSIYKAHEETFNVVMGEYKSKDEAYNVLGRLQSDMKELIMAAVTTVSATSFFSILTGAFLKEEDARSFAEEFSKKGKDTYIESVEGSDGTKNWLVRIGKENIPLDEASGIIKQSGRKKAVIISEETPPESCKKSYRILTKADAVKELMIPPEPPRKPVPPYTIQLASYYSKEMAQIGLEKCRNYGLSPLYLGRRGNLWITCMGYYENRQAAENAKAADKARILKAISPRSDAFSTKIPGSSVTDFSPFEGKLSPVFQRPEPTYGLSDMIDYEACFV